MKLKILLLVDTPLGKPWAWTFKAIQLKKNLPQYDIDIKQENSFTVNDLKNYDSIHFFSWMIGRFLRDDIKKLVTIGISSHNYELRFWNKSSIFIPKMGAVTCVSEILYNRIKEQKLNSKIYSCYNGVDTDFFCPYNMNHTNEKFTVLWCGQKTKGVLNNYSGTDLSIDMKGYEHILLPLKERLKEYPDIELIINNNTFENAVSHQYMRETYNKANVFLSTSLREGTPNTAFEAAACGIPVIGTKEGCMPQLIKDGETGFLINSFRKKEDVESTINSIIEKILYLKDNRIICENMGKAARKEVENNWTWKERAKQWIPVFEENRCR